MAQKRPMGDDGKALTPPRPFTASDLETVRRMMDAGYGRNEIAKVLDRPYGMITRAAKKLGKEFDYEQVRAATEAKQASNRERRARLAANLLKKAEGLLADLDKSFTAYNFGGKDNSYAEMELDGPPPDAVRNLMTSIQSAAKTSLELEKFDTDPTGAQSDFDAFMEHMEGGAEQDDDGDEDDR